MPSSPQDWNWDLIRPGPWLRTLYVCSLWDSYHAGCREVLCISSVVFPIPSLVYRTHCNCFSVFPAILVASMVSTAWESEHSVLRCPEESFHSCCSLHPPASLSAPSLDYWCAPWTSPPTLNSLILPSVNFSHSAKWHFLLLVQKAAWVLLGRAGLLEEHCSHPQH